MTFPSLRACRCINFCAIFCVGWLQGAFLDAQPPGTSLPPSHTEVLFFETRIRPVLVEHCYECHSADSDEPGGGLVLDTRGGLRAGGQSGPAIVEGKPKSSLLLVAMLQKDKLIMPPKDYGERLSDAVLRDFSKWIEMGAPDPREQGIAPKGYGSPEVLEWWAWQPLKASSQRVERPMADLPYYSAIDGLVQDKLSSHGLSPSGPADRAALVRRLCVDLTGLIPTSQQLRQYVDSDRPAPIEALIAELIDSEAFGEQMGQHWLDVARYAESSGKDFNAAYPHAWRYRDYVIDAFNADMPFDQFIREQLAGDLLEHRSEAERARHLVATGFLAVGTKGLNERNPRQFAVDLADEQIDALSQAFLGVTIACARCHDHKFDPISQKDYTALAGIFLSTETRFGTSGGVGGINRGALVELPSLDTVDEADKRSLGELATLRQRLQSIEQELRDVALQRQRNDAQQTGQILRLRQQQTRLQLELDAFDAAGNPKALAMGVVDRPAAGSDATFSLRSLGRNRRANNPYARFTALGTITNSPQLIRGEIDKPGEIVPRGLPSHLAAGQDGLIPADQSGRLHLANWIASEQNPLTARVIVNRVWTWMMGTGLVNTLDNFGTTGEHPSNPELLDYLASELIRSGWSIKVLVAAIASSETYQQSSDYRDDGFAVDPDNRWYWRAEPKPMSAEALRDGLLLVGKQLQRARPTGSLVDTDGLIGRRVSGGVTEQELTEADPPYRSVYLPVARGVLPESMELFDFGDRDFVKGSRDLTIVPAQALYWMNNASVQGHCEHIAELTLSEQRGGGFNRSPSGVFGRTSRNRVDSMGDSEILQVNRQLSRAILGREPLAEESASVLEYVLALQQQDVKSIRIWTGVVRSLFASSDYRFLR